MAKLSKKQELISIYPQYKDYIEEQWNWYEGKDEFGREVWNDEFDIPKTQSNIFEAVNYDILNMYASELSSTNKDDIVFDDISGEFISKKDLAFFQALSFESYGIYGD